MMPGIGFIGGTLSVIGGYSWPGGVTLIENWDDINDEWIKSNMTLKYPRYELSRNYESYTILGSPQNIIISTIFCHMNNSDYNLSPF